MSTPLVSIIIPTYNRAAFLPATLASVLSQDYPAKEIIVVDDGSTDETPGICAKHPVCYLRQQNRGGGAARNAGAKHAKGGLLVFLDDDDMCVEGSIAIRVKHWLREPHYDLIMGKLRRFEENPSGKLDFIDGENTMQVLCLGAALVTRRGFEQAGGFDEAVPVDGGDDVDLWVRMREAGQRQKFIDDVCLYYRCHPGNATGDLRKATRGFLNVLRVAMQRRRGGQQGVRQP